MVIDASIAIAWELPDEQNAEADQILWDLRKSIAAVVPSIFWHELRNTLLVAERRGRLSAGEARSAMREIRALPLEDAGHGSDQVVLDLAIRHSLSAYDAAYLALAVTRNLSLATNDRCMAEAAAAEQVQVRGRRI